MYSSELGIRVSPIVDYSNLSISCIRCTQEIGHCAYLSCAVCLSILSLRKGVSGTCIHCDDTKSRAKCIRICVCDCEVLAANHSVPSISPPIATLIQLPFPMSEGGRASAVMKYRFKSMSPSTEIKEAPSGTFPMMLKSLL